MLAQSSGPATSEASFKLEMGARIHTSPHPPTTDSLYLYHNDNNTKTPERPTLFHLTLSALPIIASLSLRLSTMHFPHFYLFTLLFTILPSVSASPIESNTDAATQTPYTCSGTDASISMGKCDALSNCVPTKAASGVAYKRAGYTGVVTGRSQAGLGDSLVSLCYLNKNWCEELMFFFVF